MVMLIGSSVCLLDYGDIRRFAATSKVCGRHEVKRFVNRICKAKVDILENRCQATSKAYAKISAEVERHMMRNEELETRL